jgi:hypothetical protein
MISETEWPNLELGVCKSGLLLVAKGVAALMLETVEFDMALSFDGGDETEGVAGVVHVPTFKEVLMTFPASTKA